MVTDALAIVRRSANCAQGAGEGGVSVLNMSATLSPLDRTQLGGPSAIGLPF